jgi:hypothetical protein
VGLKIASFLCSKEAKGFSLPLLLISSQESLKGSALVHKKALQAPGQEK